MSKKPVITPTIHVNKKTGKKYIFVNGQRAYINAKMTKKEITSIYNLLIKNIKANNINKAKAVVNINNVPPKRNYRRGKPKNTGPSDPKGILPAIVSNSNSKNRENEDKINSVVNENNAIKNQLLQLTNNQNILGPPVPDQNLLNFQNSNEYKIFKIKQDPKYQKIATMPQQTEHEILDKLRKARKLGAKYGLVFSYPNVKHPGSNVPSYVRDSNIIDIHPIIREKPKNEKQRQKEEEEISEYDYQQVYGYPKPNPEKDLEKHLNMTKEKYGEPQSPQQLPQQLPQQHIPVIAVKDMMHNDMSPEEYNALYEDEPRQEEGKRRKEEVKRRKEEEEEEEEDFLKQPEKPELQLIMPEGLGNLFNFDPSKFTVVPTESSIQIQQQQYENFDPNIVDFSIIKKVVKELREKHNIPVQHAPDKTTKKYIKYLNDFLPTIDQKAIKLSYDSVMNKLHGNKFGMGIDKDEGGLYDDQIDKIMSRYKDYYGTIMRDEIKTILPYIKSQSRVSFIMNTDPSDKEGKHWIAVYIDGRSGPESSNSIEYYDSFARPIPKDILADIKLILKIIKPVNILKLKENRVIAQNPNSDSCGWMAAKFLIDRFRHQSFSSATKYDEKIQDKSKENEKEIERLKNSPPFNYIY